MNHTFSKTFSKTALQVCWKTETFSSNFFFLLLQPQETSSQKNQKQKQNAHIFKLATGRRIPFAKNRSTRTCE